MLPAVYDHGALVSGMVGRDTTYKGQKGRGIGGDPEVRPRGVVVLRHDTLLTEARLKRTEEEPVITSHISSITTSRTISLHGP